MAQINFLLKNSLETTWKAKQEEKKGVKCIIIIIIIALNVKK